MVAVGGEKRVVENHFPLAGAVGLHRVHAAAFQEWVNSVGDVLLSLKDST